jgi:type VI secretion system secreted protein VgrG
MPDSITVTTPLSPEALRFESMTFSDGLSRLGEMQLSLSSPSSSIAAEALLGKPVSVQVMQRDGNLRFFNGHVTRFAIGAHRGRHFGYQATVRPWLWFLTRTADCRIFQDLTAPEIVKQVFADHGVANFEFTLSRNYRPWVYCVQYRESDYNFVARLLEHEGIYWYFEHTAGQHKLKLVDTKTAHDAVPGCAKLPFIAHDAQVPPDIDHVSQWLSANAVRPGKMALTSYDFERPSASLEVDALKLRGHDLADAEVFDFQGDYVRSGDGSHLLDNRIDEAHAAYEQAGGQTNAHGLSTGCLVTLERHPHEKQNQQYLVIDTEVTARADGSDFGHGATEGMYRCAFEAMPAVQQYRAPRVSPKPFVQGPQTAMVVGPAGEEIFTDRYGRVKVQFHWDRRGQKNEKSSCWVRVSHPWAGKSFGGIHIPRIGQEVVVDFLEGDPDQPLITGRVYNAEQMPPWDLPANATQSGFLTRSTNGGHYGTANALRFEDKKGEEQLWIHAERNQDIEVENDETHWVGQDRKKAIDRDETTHVKRDRAETVDHDETITIHHDRVERVDNDESISIGRDRQMSISRDKKEAVTRNKSIHVDGSHSEKISGSMTITVGSALTENVFANYAETVGGAMEITVGAAMAITVGGALAETVGGALVQAVGAASTELVGGNRTITVGKTLSETVKGEKILKVIKNSKEEVTEKKEVTIGKEYIVKAKKIEIVAEDEIHLKTGDAELVMKKNGDILLKGGKINVNGSGDVILKGSKIKGN